MRQPVHWPLQHSWCQSPKQQGSKARVSRTYICRLLYVAYMPSLWALGVMQISIGRGHHDALRVKKAEDWPITQDHDEIATGHRLTQIISNDDDALKRMECARLAKFYDW